VDMNATDSPANAINNLVDAKEKLYESKLKSRAYYRFTDAKNDRSSKRFRQETIISEEDKKKSGTNTVPKADERVEEESYSSNYVSSSLIGIFSKSYSQQQTSSDSSSLLCFEEIFRKRKYDFIVDLSLSSKIRGQFSNEEWDELVKRRPDAIRKSYHHEIESIISHLFSQKMDLLQARKKWYELRNWVAPKYNNELSYTENDWGKNKTLG
ncbi:12568_t:CDS:2, partial [Acaulospora colombiana]